MTRKRLRGEAAEKGGKCAAQRATLRPPSSFSDARSKVIFPCYSKRLLSRSSAAVSSPSGIPLSFLILPGAALSNGRHSHPLIGEREFCHYLINVQVSARSGSSAPLGTSVRVHPSSHGGVRSRKTHAHFGPYAHASYCHFGY